MHSTTDPTMMLGRPSRICTDTEVIDGTILAVGAKGVSVAINRRIVRIHPSDIRSISQAN